MRVHTAQRIKQWCRSGVGNHRRTAAATNLPKDVHNRGKATVSQPFPKHPRTEANVQQGQQGQKELKLAVGIAKSHDEQKDTTETAPRLHDEIQRNPEGPEAVFSKVQDRDLSFTVLKDTEVIHREVKGWTKNNCDLKGNQSEFSEARRKEMAKRHSEFATRRRATEHVV